MRDTYFLLGLLLLFAAVNIGLVASGILVADWTGLGIIVAAGMTLALYSFLYKDNPLFKFAEHVFVGVAAAYMFGQYWYPTLYGELIAEWTDLGEGETPNWWLLAPTVLGLLMLTRFSLRFGWLSRYAFAFFVGLGAGLTIPRYISSFILAQIEPTLQPLTWSLEGLKLLSSPSGGHRGVGLFLFFRRAHRHGGPHLQGGDMVFDGFVWGFFWLHHYGEGLAVDRACDLSLRRLVAPDVKGVLSTLQRRDI